MKESIIEICERVVRNHQYEKHKLDGHIETIDAVTAQTIVNVHDALSDANKEKFATLPLRRMVAIAWKLLERQEATA